MFLFTLGVSVLSTAIVSILTSAVSFIIIRKSLPVEKKPEVPPTIEEIVAQLDESSWNFSTTTNEQNVARLATILNHMRSNVAEIQARMANGSKPSSDQIVNAVKSTATAARSIMNIMTSMRSFASTAQTEPTPGCSHH